MKATASGRKYIVSRAVEEPLEATFELGEDIQDISGKLTKPVAIGIFGNILLILLLLPSIYLLFLFLTSIYNGEKEITTQLILSSVVLSLILIFFISILVAIIIYLYQIHKFNAYLLQRYSLVTELKRAQYEVDRPSKKPRPKNDIDRSIKENGKAKHLQNPIFAMIDLVEEYMHELPQLVKLLRFSTFLIIITVLFLVFAAILKIGFGWELFFAMGMLELAFGAVAVILLIPNLKLLIDSENLINYLKIRHDIIDSVRFGKNIRVPKGKDQLTRLIKYLTKNDPYIKSSATVYDEGFKNNIKLKGSSGKEYRFDAYFAGVNILKEESVSLGMPMGKFAVYIKVFDHEVTHASLEELRDAVLDVYNKDDIFPLRVIAHQSEIHELEDEVYYFAIDKPIKLKNTLTHIQIAGEDGEVYSFIPMISYGKEVG
jgi:hypothetical protein